MQCILLLCNLTKYIFVVFLSYITEFNLSEVVTASIVVVVVITTLIVLVVTGLVVLAITAVVADAVITSSRSIMSLSVNQVLEILRTQEPVSELPFRPKGGEIICFKADGVKSQDWRSDGHRWINQGTVGLPQSNQKVKKKYFYIANESGGASKDFVKFVYHHHRCFLAT